MTAFFFLLQKFPVYRPNFGPVGLWLLKVSCSCCEHSLGYQREGPIGGGCSPMGCAALSLIAGAMHRLGLWVGRGGLAGGGCSPEAVQPRRHSVPGRAACVWWGLCGQCYRRLPSRARLCACRNWSRFRLRCWCAGGFVASWFCAVRTVVTGAPGVWRAAGLRRFSSAAR